MVLLHSRDGVKTLLHVLSKPVTRKDTILGRLFTQLGYYFTQTKPQFDKKKQFLDLGPPKKQATITSPTWSRKFFSRT